MECLAEIVEGLRPPCLLADDCVGFKPDQIALIVEVGAPPVGFPIRTGIVQDLRLIGAILERPPLTPGTIVQPSGEQCEILAVLLGSPQA